MSTISQPASTDKVADASKTHDRANAASRAKSNFLATMNYEILTQMNAITGMTRIGKSSKDLERISYCFNRIEEATELLLETLSNFFDVSRIESGLFKLKLQRFNFAEMLQMVVSVFSSNIQDRKLDLDVYVENAVPNYMVGDNQRLGQVIANLLGNAIKFTPEKGSIRINVGLVKDEGDFCTIKVSVSDTGIGISNEQQAELFKPFWQAERDMERSLGGSGLGLAISKKIVEEMSGEIWVVSEIDKGSVFSFTVYLQRGQDDKNDRHREPNAVKDEHGNYVIMDRYSGRRILLAEDLEINREIVQDLLEPTLVDIDCAKSGKEAVDMFTENPDKYDMILMDLLMPDMDGYEATEIIRAMDTPKAKSIPIVAITANTLKDDVDRCYEVGMNGHIGKPLVIGDMLEQMHRFLRK
jgi:CheY-like chemotaxis protein